MVLTEFEQDIYLVQTAANQKKVPKDWIKSGSTKVRPPVVSTTGKELTRWLVCFEMEGQLPGSHDSQLERSNRK